MTLIGRTQKTVLLDDGRKLAYAELGDPDGRPVFYFHGFPGSRLEAKTMHEQASEVGWRLIAVDRPGFGMSDFQPNRKITDWPKDIEELADLLEIENFSIFGFSTGACYALACATCLAERINTIVLLSSLGSVEFKQNGLYVNHRFIFGMAKLFPLLFKIMFRWIRCRQLQKEDRGERYLKLNYNNFSEKDRILLQDSNLLDIIAEAHCEAFRKGLKGITHEAKLLGSPWSINFEKIPKKLDIYIFHGAKDRIAKVAAAREIEKLLQRCKATYFEDEGHVSLIANSKEEIFNILGVTIS